MRQLGPYLLVDRIGAGGMAEVWVGQRETLGARKSVAIKLLAPNLTAKSKYREMFLEEARLSMLLSNSNIVQVFDAGEVNGECFMAMEWVDGANLAELQGALWKAGRPVPIDVAMYIIGEVLRALDYAHNVKSEGSATIVHRDVSPANIMVSIAGEVKLTDFGVARFGSEETSGLHVKGKLRYMPAEQLKGRSKEGTVDLYSVGAVLQEMLDGSKFRGASTDEAELLGMIFSDVVPELADPSRCSHQLDELRRRLLEPEPTRRIATAREALAQLRACPGYRVAAQEVGALVRWYRGLDPEDKGFRPHRITESKVAVSAAQVSDTSVSQLGQTGGSQVRRQRVQTIAAAAALALLGLFIASMSMVFAVLNFEAPGGELPLMIAAGLERSESVAAEAPEPADEVGEENEDEGETDGLLALVEDEPASGEGELVEDEGVAGAETGGGDGGETGIEAEGETGEEAAVEEDEDDGAEAGEADDSVKPRPKPKADPVQVKIAAGPFGFAYVKVGGRRLLIEPSGTTKLKPGRHRVRVRFDPNDKWTSFGRVRIQPNHSYLIQLQKPKGVKLTKLK